VLGFGHPDVHSSENIEEPIAAAALAAADALLAAAVSGST